MGRLDRGPGRACPGRIQQLWLASWRSGGVVSWHGNHPFTATTDSSTPELRAYNTPRSHPARLGSTRPIIHGTSPLCYVPEGPQPLATPSLRSALEQYEPKDVIA